MTGKICWDACGGQGRACSLLCDPAPAAHRPSRRAGASFGMRQRMQSAAKEGERTSPSLCKPPLFRHRGRQGLGLSFHKSPLRQRPFKRSTARRVGPLSPCGGYPADGASKACTSSPPRLFAGLPCGQPATRWPDKAGFKKRAPLWGGAGGFLIRPSGCWFRGRSRRNPADGGAAVFQKTRVKGRRAAGAGSRTK